MRIKIIITIILLYIIIPAYSQELNCRVQVMHQQIQGTNKQVFQNMQKAIYEFMNNRKWTKHVYSNDERIECNLLFNITNKISSDEFKATLQIQSSRPVYNSTYNSVMFNYRDNDIHFKYSEFQSLEFNINTHTSNLTSILAYYAYVILGLDYDSFSLEGGGTYWQKAEKIVNNAQNSTKKGWKAFESKKNRYWLVENILDSKFTPVRECLYNYHRIGLDVMAEKPEDGRTIILDAIETLRKVHRAKPGSFVLQLFFNAKADEIVNVFSEAFTNEKNRVYNILSDIDPANLNKYKKLTQNK